MWIGTPITEQLLGKRERIVDADVAAKQQRTVLGTKRALMKCGNIVASERFERTGVPATG